MDVPRPLTRADEIELFEEMRQAECATRRAIRGVGAADAVLAEPATRRQRTRGTAIDRLGRAVAAAEAAALDDPALAGKAAGARRAWDRHEALMWQVVLASLPVVEWVVRKMPPGFLDREDLVAEGTLGLVDAARRFDPRRGIRFDTYARWWVRARMTRAIEHGGRPIHLPGGGIELLRNARREERSRSARGLPSDTATLAALMGADPVRLALLLAQAPVSSFDQVIPESGGSTLGDTLPSDEPGPDDAVVATTEAATLRALVPRIPDSRQRKVLVARYGLDERGPRTLNAVGRELGLSRERVRQIEQHAIRWLRDQIGSGMPLRSPVAAA